MIPRPITACLTALLAWTPAEAASGGLGLPADVDPRHGLLRLTLGLAGVLVAALGAGLPRLLARFRKPPERYDWPRTIRACGWTLTLGGLLGALCGLLDPRPPVAGVGAVTLFLSAAVAAVLIWARARFGASASPPNRRPDGSDESGANVN